MTDHPADNRIEFLRRQRQTRSYLNQPIPPESLANILDVARWTGSAGNKQRWKLVVVQNRDHNQQLGAIKSDTGWVADASVVVVLLTEGATAEAGRFDAGRMAERLLLAAQAEGLGAGIIGFGDATSNTAVRELLHVPDGLWIFAAVVIGFAAEPESTGQSSKGGRKPIDEIVVHESF